MVNTSGSIPITVIMSLQAVSVVSRHPSYLYHQIEPHLDHATVKRYDEHSIDQERFDDDHFFHRYNLEYRARRIIVSTGMLFQSTSIDDSPFIAQGLE